MKHIIILGDGMADWPEAALGDKTLLQYAQTPYMDLLAKQGRTGTLVTVPEGFHPGSEVANMSILGYCLNDVYEGRGVLEAANMGVELQPGDMAMRCNLINIEGDHIKNHSAGRLETAEAAELIECLNRELGDAHIHFYTGVQYRHLLVIKGGDKHLICIPPHDVPMQPFRPLLVKPACEEAEATAQLLNNMILNSQSILENHPVNRRRKAEGKDAANSIWPWSPGYRPHMQPLCEKFPQIHSGAVISAVDLINGIGHYAGLRPISVEEATGLYDTNYANKVAAALEALRTDDFVFLHIEASDEAGHDGDLSLKQLTIENLDKQVVGPIFEATKDWNEHVAIAVLPDHPTPCRLRTHTAEPVPFLVYCPDMEPDNVEQFDEFSCLKGGFSQLKGEEFMKLFINL